MQSKADSAAVAPATPTRLCLSFGRRAYIFGNRYRQLRRRFAPLPGRPERTARFSSSSDIGTGRA
jgi:hypothetical protein